MQPIPTTPKQNSKINTSNSISSIQYNDYKIKKYECSKINSPQNSPHTSPNYHNSSITRKGDQMKIVVKKYEGKPEIKPKVENKFEIDFKYKKK